MRTHIDLSHTIEENLVTYKGLPPPLICDYLSREASKSFYAEGTSFQIGRIDMVSNTGTYIDCPFHRYEGGKDLSEVALEKLVDLPAVLIHAPWQNGLAIGTEFFQYLDLYRKAVLIHTGWATFWNTGKYYSDHPFVTEEAALLLRDQGAGLVGIDSHNIDDTRGNARPVHSILLHEEILIVEHLCNLEQIPSVNFLFSAAPPKILNMGTFPVRAYATINL